MLATVKRLLLLAVLVAVTASLLPARANAARGLDAYCSPTGDYCTSVIRAKRRVKFVLRTFAFTGEYVLCVTSPSRDRRCRSFSLYRGKHGIYASRIDFARQFGFGGKGRYRVTWRYGGARLGEPLFFARR